MLAHEALLASLKNLLHEQQGSMSPTVRCCWQDAGGQPAASMYGHIHMGKKS
jgi:hypothetical protein